MKLLSRLLLSLIFLAGWSAAAHADAPDRRIRLDIERFRPAPDATAGFALGDPRGLEFGEFALSLHLYDAFYPLVLERDNGERVALVSNRLGGALSGIVGVGLQNRLSIGIDVPFVLYQSGSLAELPLSAQPVAGGALGAVALGDLRISPRISILREEVDGLDLGVDVALSLPTGRTQALFGDRGVGGLATVSAARRFADVRVLAQLGARLRPSSQAVRAAVGSELVVRAAALYDLKLGDEFYIPRQLIAELDMGTLFSSFGESETSPAEWRLGARFCAMPNLAVTAGGGGGFSSAYGTPFARLNLGVAWDGRACTGPAAPDTDGDGIPDANDECPTEAGLPELNGCPPPADTDGDGVADDVDECPTVPGVAEYAGCPAPDTDGDGVPDDVDECPNEPGVPAYAGCPVPDTDGDGILDDVDECPQVPGVAEYAGCPPPDRDGDGVPDSEDACPDEPGPVERKGCPIIDTDGDGVPDDEDECPSEPGPVERKGCPIIDTDGDGVPDDEDNCPREPGPASNFGCKVKQIVVIRREQIEILEKVLFATNKATIDKRSFKLLDQVASVIQEHPEISKIRVEGHTDNVGKAGHNMTLSQQRAEAVRDYLVRKGVASERLEAVGYGQERPLAPNVTARGRETNRRVEFHISESSRRVAPGLAPASTDDAKAVEEAAAKKAAAEAAAKKAAEEAAAKKAAEEAAAKKAAEEAAAKKAADEAAAKKAAEEAAAKKAVEEAAAKKAAEEAAAKKAAEEAAAKKAAEEAAAKKAAEEAAAKKAAEEAAAKKAADEAAAKKAAEEAAAKKAAEEAAAKKAAEEAAAKKAADEAAAKKAAEEAAAKKAAEEAAAKKAAEEAAAKKAAEEAAAKKAAEEVAAQKAAEEVAAQKAAEEAAAKKAAEEAAAKKAAEEAAAKKAAEEAGFGFDDLPFELPPLLDD